MAELPVVRILPVLPVMQVLPVLPVLPGLPVLPVLRHRHPQPHAHTHTATHKTDNTRGILLPDRIVLYFWEGQREHKVLPGGHKPARKGQFRGQRRLFCIFGKVRENTKCYLEGTTAHGKVNSAATEDGSVFLGRSKGNPICCWERDCAHPLVGPQQASFLRTSTGPGPTVSAIPSRLQGIAGRPTCEFSCSVEPRRFGSDRLCTRP